MRQTECTNTTSMHSSDANVQCNLLENKNYWLRFAKLQQKLVSFVEASDLMKSQLEAVCDVLEPSVQEISKSNKNIGATLSNMSRSSKHLLGNYNSTVTVLYIHHLSTPL